MTADASTGSEPAHDAVPLGPESLTWQYFGQLAGFAGGSVLQLLQLMHPVLGHAVEDHSTVRSDPFDRLIRSMGPIYGVVYDGPHAARTATQVRSYHERIKGVLPDGQRYSGLNPEVYHWAHATFVHGLVYGFSELCGPFTRAEQEQLYAESRQWYALYGMTMRNVPETLDEFDAYWERYVDEVLEATTASQWLLDIFARPPQPPGFEWIPTPLWRLIRIPGAHAALVFTAGLMPPTARERLGLRYGVVRRLEFQVLRHVVRTAVRLTPRRFRYHPRPLAGWKREAASRATTVSRLIRQSEQSAKQPRSSGTAAAAAHTPRL
ncbi:MAG TPA: oxygenase MpaB family protein [Nocardioidaceae bacterium]|nr:oxygenase MpaB family protein [Nocardioidaceae bacterium]